jgi:hypothetical protein
MYGWWQANRFDRKQRKRAKELVGYACSSVILRPDFKREIPMWQLTDPLSTFPAPMPDPDDICPTDTILAYRRHLSWLTERYPQKARALELGRDPSPDTELEVLEYIDAETHVLVAVGRPYEAPSRNPLYGGDSGTPGLPYVELERFPNRVGRCTLVYATRPSLEFPISQFDGMPAVYKMQARAMALWIIASERSIFPDMWVIDRPNSTNSEIVQYPDGRAGIAGHIHDGDIKEVGVSSPPQIAQIIQMLEMNQRQSSGLSQQLGGENPSNVRTGRAGEQLLSATIDYWIQEAQETLAASYEEENRLAVQIAKKYFGDIAKSFYVTWKGAKQNVDYIPNSHFENDNNIVSWPMAGSDINQLVVGLGQRLGLEEMSVQSAQEKDPYIDDPEEEFRRLTAESVNKAFMASVDQAVAGGQVGPTELARFVELVQTGRMDPYKAWQQLHQETQEQQAAQQQPGQGGPQPGSPEAMPGLSAPGVQGAGMQAAQGLPQPGPAAGVSQPPPGLGNLHDLLGALHGGQPTPAGR